MCRPLNAERLFWDKLMRQILSLKEARQVQWSVGLKPVLATKWVLLGQLQKWTLPCSTDCAG